jgi:hypothetical protein
MAITVQPAQQARCDAARGVAIGLDRSRLCLLGATLALALVLRLWGLGWGLPWAFHPDEIFYVDQAQDMLRFGDPNPKYFKNPSLLTYLIAGELLLARALGQLAGPLAPGAPGATYLLARLDSALLGTAGVALLYATGTALGGRRVGLVAAALLAVAFLHVRDSHYGVNDVPASTLLILSLYFDVRLLRNPSPGWYLLASLAGGFATSTKYNMGLFFVPLLAAHLLATRGMGPSGPRSLTMLALAAAAGLGGYLLGTPYTVLDIERFSGDFLTQYQFGNQRWLGQPPDPVPLLYLTTLLQGFGAVPLGLALLGAALGWHTRRAETLLLLAFPAAYLLFLLPKALFFPRFALPLLPFLALLAAFGVADLAGRLGGSAARQQSALAGLLALAAVQSLANDLLHNRLLLHADTRILANEWVQASLPRGSHLKVEDYSLRDLSTQARTYTPNTAELHIERFEGSPEADSARYFAERNVQYVVTSSFAYDRYLLDPPSPSQRESSLRYQRLHRSLEQRAELVARFSPGVGGQEVPYSLDNSLTPFWMLERYERPGPTIRIYSRAPLAGAGS